VTEEPNPMEATRPSLVQFPVDETEHLSAEEFCRRRQGDREGEGEWIASSHHSSDHEDEGEWKRKNSHTSSCKSVEVISDLDASTSLAFAQKRKSHYNEGEMLKQLRLRMALDISDSDTECEPE